MSFDWSQYLTLALELAGRSGCKASKEAKLRSSVSRAYYAAFCKARNYLRDAEGHTIPSTGDAHKYVRDQFESSSDTKRKKIGVDLHRLRNSRNAADYYDFVPALNSVVQVALSRANKVISVLPTI
jgi:uncharacterized protein (UPF0332 family)